MNIRQLETFIRVVEDGSFAAAAESLHCTQSTVSARIKELEHHFGVPLFDRGAHRNRLTLQGQELYDGAQELLDLARGLRERIGNESAMAGLLRLGAVGHVASTWLPALVARLRERHPALRVRIQVALSRTLVDQLVAGQLDIALVAGIPAEPSLRSEAVARDAFVWMASPSLEIPPQACHPAGLAQWPLLSFPEDSHHFPVVKKWFRDAGVPFRIAITSNNMDLLARLVAEKQGIAMLPRDYYTADIEAGRLQVLETTPPIESVDFYLAYSSKRNPAFVQRIARCIREVRP